MTDEKEHEEAAEERDDDAVRALLKRSLGEVAPPEAPPPNLLRGVQQRIRSRSKGKFYSDGWSTTQSRVNYALVAALMLLVVAIAYVVLGPMGVSAR